MFEPPVLPLSSSRLPARYVVCEIEAGSLTDSKQAMFEPPVLPLSSNRLPARYVELKSIRTCIK
jgi:hypothetical protein